MPFVLDFLRRKPIEIEVSRAQLPGDAGLLPIRQFDEAIGLIERFADALRAQARQQFDETGQKQRLFLALESQADAWPQSRQVVVKCEVHEQGTNRRVVSTNRPGRSANPG